MRARRLPPLLATTAAAATAGCSHMSVSCPTVSRWWRRGAAELRTRTFGIHGAAEPANIGYRTSHSRVRLTTP